MIKTLTIGTILTLFSTPSFAQSSQHYENGLTSFLPLILIFGVGYFIWRRAKKNAKEAAELEEAAAELLEQRFIEIENRLDVIERS